MRKKENYLSLISFRGLFIMMIILYHMGNNFTMIFEPVLGWCYNWGGHLGNTFFFMVSGFLLSHGYEDRISKGEISFVDFIKRRMIKIVPLYLITNLFRLGLNIATIGIAALKFDDFLRVVFMAASGWVTNITPYNDPTWFVCVLILAYVVYYFVARVKDKNRDVYILLIFILIVYGRSLNVLGLQLPFMRSGDGQAIYCFFIGVALYELVTSSYYNLKKTIWICGNVLSMTFCLLAAWKGVASVATDVPMVISFLLVPTIILDAVLSKSIRTIFSLRPLVMLGKMSMSLYFIHGPLIAVFRMMQGRVLGVNVFLLYVIFLIILFVVSGLSYVFLEPDAEKIIKKIFEKNPI